MTEEGLHEKAEISHENLKIFGFNVINGNSQRPEIQFFHSPVEVCWREKGKFVIGRSAWR